MPLEIRELVIKASVGEAQSGGEGGSAAAPASGEQDQAVIVNLCVEKVLEILKEKAER